MFWSHIDPNSCTSAGSKQNWCRGSGFDLVAERNVIEFVRGKKYIQAEVITSSTDQVHYRLTSFSHVPILHPFHMYIYFMRNFYLQVCLWKDDLLVFEGSYIQRTRTFSGSDFMPKVSKYRPCVRVLPEFWQPIHWETIRAMHGQFHAKVALEVQSKFLSIRYCSRKPKALWCKLCLSWTPCYSTTISSNSYTAIQLTGLVGGLPAGEWEVQVYVNNIGFASAEEPILVNVSLSLWGVEPAVGGVLGGTLLTIFGIGIGPGLAVIDR